MQKYTQPSTFASPLFVGMDVHKKTIAFCVYDDETGELIDERQLPNDWAKVRKYIDKVRKQHGEPQCCYEASSCGFVLYRALGVHCDVIAPSSIPRRPGDRVKTDRRDARKLATLYAASLLTPVTVPDEEREAMRSLVRCRADLVDVLTRTKQRALFFVQARGYRYRGGSHWTCAFRKWITTLPLSAVDQITLQAYLHKITYLEQEVRRLEDLLAQAAQKDRYRDTVNVLSAFRGIGLITALTLVCELGDIRRFAHPRQLMAYLGLVPSEHTSGDRVMRGSITKTGNTHARKALVSTAWKYAAAPRCSAALRARQQGVSAEVIRIAWKAQCRLHKRFRKLIHSKSRCVANVAVARELAGFLWEAMQTHAGTAVAQAA